MATSYRPTNDPWRISTQDDYAVDDVGGTVIQLEAATALLLGDYVYMTSSGEAAKNTTDTLYVAGLGIVVGGEAFFDMIIQDAALIAAGTAVAADGERVLVCIAGICLGYAEATVVLGAQLGPDATTAGRVNDGATATAGQIAGIALAVGGTDVAVKMLVQRM